MLNTILEILVIGSGTLAVLLTGKAMLTPRTEKNLEQISYLQFRAMIATGVCVVSAYLVVALTL